jgi:hypothetical protein
MGRRYETAVDCPENSPTMTDRYMHEICKSIRIGEWFIDCCGITSKSERNLKRSGKYWNGKKNPTKCCWMIDKTARSLSDVNVGVVLIFGLFRSLSSPPSWDKFQFRFQNATDAVKKAIWIGRRDDAPDPASTIEPSPMNKSRTASRNAEENDSHLVKMT